MLAPEWQCHCFLSPPRNKFQTIHLFGVPAHIARKTRTRTVEWHHFLKQTATQNGADFKVHSWVLSAKTRDQFGIWYHLFLYRRLKSPARNSDTARLKKPACWVRGWRVSIIFVFTQRQLELFLARMPPRSVVNKAFGLVEQKMSPALLLDRRRRIFCKSC